MEYAHYDLAYMFAYSERPGTLAARRFQDDVPEAVKKQRLAEVVELHRRHSLESMQQDVGKTFRVLIEGVSKKSPDDLFGRTDHNKVVVFPKGSLEKGMYTTVQVHACTAGTLIGTVVGNG
jgi:tRNA-2-methylthio-N6-dimethylallyladenosine synthase